MHKIIYIFVPVTLCVCVYVSVHTDMCMFVQWSLPCKDAQKRLTVWVWMPRSFPLHSILSPRQTGGSAQRCEWRFALHSLTCIHTSLSPNTQTLSPVAHYLIWKLHSHFLSSGEILVIFLSLIPVVSWQEGGIALNHSPCFTRPLWVLRR